MKDETRKKILLVLNERGSLSYTDIMDNIGCLNTGKLNYHLKVLNDLLMKTEDGRYTLSEKGSLALRLLQEFGEKKSQSEIEAPFPKAVYSAVSLSVIAFVSITFASYITGTINFNQFLMNISLAVIGIIFVFVAEKARVKRGQLGCLNVRCLEQKLRS